jgi:replicative superfamily II helicase
MKVQELQKFGIDSEITRIWVKKESDTLLPVQEQAIKEHKILEGHDLLVSAPTSSGKTFLAEIAALYNIFRRRKVIYLVPLKALAEEKYADFSDKYSGFGIKVVLSTGDRSEFDIAILKGDFQLAIIVFEKMNRLLIRNKALISNTGLVIVDEIQITIDNTRGANLEMLLTQILTSQEKASQKAQLIGLSAVIGDLNKLNQWLGMGVLDSAKRPVELQEGILTPDGTFKYREFLSGQMGIEKFPAFISDPRINLKSLEGWKEYQYRRLAHFVSYLVRQGEQVLVFRKWKGLTRETAFRLAMDLNLPPAEEAIDVLKDVENSVSKEILISALNHGIAFHNADLGSEERRVIEEYFKQDDSKIRVVCATSTLAMGINLPVKTVIINDMEKPDPDAKSFQEVPLTPAEYKNMSGRAGRFGRQDKGRSIIFAETQAQFSIFWRNYIDGEFPKMDSLLYSSPLLQETLLLIASELCRSQQDLLDFFTRSYAGYLYWNPGQGTVRTHSGTPLQAKVDRALRICAENELIREAVADEWKPTELGKICALQGVSLFSFLNLLQLLPEINPSAYHLWELLFLAVHNREIEELHFRLSPTEFDSGEYIQDIQNINPPNWESLLKKSEDLLGDRYETAKRLRMSCTLLDWIQGMDLREIELKYNRGYQDKAYSGVIRTLAENSSWMLETLAEVAEAKRYDAAFVQNLKALSRRVLYGVSEEAIALAELRVPGLTRENLYRLAQWGYTSPETLAEASVDDLQRIISRSLAVKIKEALQKKPAQKSFQGVEGQKMRLEKLGLDPALLLRVYEASELKPFAESVADLIRNLKIPSTPKNVGELEGSIDYTLQDAKATIFLRVLPPQEKEISLERIAEVLSTAAKYIPISIIIIGKPGFSTDALGEAKQLSQAYSVHVQLIAAYELGERYVEVLEGQRPVGLMFQ